MDIDIIYHILDKNKPNKKRAVKISALLFPTVIFLAILSKMYYNV